MSYGQADASGDTVHAREKVMPEHGADGAAASRPGGRAVSFNGQRQTHILIADDHEVVRIGLRAILEAHEAWAVVAEAENGKDAITKALDCKPDLAIIDYSLPVINGIEAARQIRARLPDTCRCRLSRSRTT
jgi:PleD family two-component response regulator